MTRRRVLIGLAAMALMASSRKPVSAAEPSDYVDGMSALGFELYACRAGTWWENEPLRLSASDRDQEVRLRAYWLATTARRRAVTAELRRRGLVLAG
jgi:hypothetical protein